MTSGLCSPSGKSAHPPVASSTLLGTSMTSGQVYVCYYKVSPYGCFEAKIGSMHIVISNQLLETRKI